MNIKPNVPNFLLKIVILSWDYSPQSQNIAQVGRTGAE